MNLSKSFAWEERERKKARCTSEGRWGWESRVRCWMLRSRVSIHDLIGSVFRSRVPLALTPLCHDMKDCVFMPHGNFMRKTYTVKCDVNEHEAAPSRSWTVVLGRGARRSGLTSL